MMKNFMQSGEWGLTVIAPAGGVVSGQVVIVGSIIGIPSTTQPAGNEVKVRCEGVYDLAKVPADALAAGAIAKVDATGWWWAWRVPKVSAGWSRTLPRLQYGQGEARTADNRSPAIHYKPRR